MDTGGSAFGMSMVSVSVSVLVSIPFPVPILPFLFLPAQDRPRVMLHGDQRLYRADARVDSMAPAPVLYDAVRMILLLIFVLAAISVLGVGSQAKKAEHAKRACCESEGGKLFSHDRSPIDSV